LISRPFSTMASPARLVAVAEWVGGEADRFDRTGFMLGWFGDRSSP
jgi:hypothetical protein